MEDTQKLTFKGPFHFDDLETNGQIKNHPEDFEHPNKPGIYIWGFMYSLNPDSKALEDPIDFNPRPNEKKYCEETMQFIPYYVGIADAIKGGIFGRLKEHQKVRNGNAAKYKRFSPTFYKEFFKSGSGFIPNTWGSDKEICKKYSKDCQGCPYKEIALENIKEKSKLHYTNVEYCMERIHGKKAKQIHAHEAKQMTDDEAKKKNVKECPILKYEPILKDSLYELVGNENNFWFCYAVPDISEFISKKAILTQLETFTFWSLKGMTISQTGEQMNMNIDDNTNSRIFKESPSRGFPGYVGEIQPQEEPMKH